MILEVMACREIQGEKFMVSNSRLTCDSDVYTRFTNPLLLPLFLLWVLVIPFIIFAYLKKNNKPIS